MCCAGMALPRLAALLLLVLSKGGVAGDCTSEHSNNVFLHHPCYPQPITVTLATGEKGALCVRVACVGSMQGSSLLASWNRSRVGHCEPGAGVREFVTVNATLQDGTHSKIVSNTQPGVSSNNTAKKLGTASFM